MSGKPTPAILAGGAFHGRRITVDAANSVIWTPEPLRVPLTVTLPERPPWWRLVRRHRWQPPEPPEPPTFRALAYRENGTLSDGTRVFWLEESPNPARRLPAGGTKLEAT